MTELEFRDGAGRNIGRGRAYGFVAHVHPIHIYAGRAAEAATECDRRVAGLRWVEVLPVLDLHARLKLRQVEEVSPINRQVLNLARAQNALYDPLLRIDL